MSNFFIVAPFRLIRSAAVFGMFASLLAAASSLTWTEDLPFTASWPNFRIPKWCNGALLEVQFDDTTQPLIWLYDRQGSYSIPFSIPAARSMTIYDWDRGLRGDMGLTGSVIDVEGRGTAFIGWISSDQNRSVVIRTGMYRPVRLAVAPDGTVWTAGPELMTAPGVGVIRHFDQSGTLLASAVQQSTIAETRFLSDRRNRMMASKDRIAWYSPLGGRYIEVTLGGQLIADFSVAPPGILQEGYGFALTDKNEAYLTAVSSSSSNGVPNGQILGVYTLDKVGHSWKSLMQWPLRSRSQPNGVDIGHLYGVDGDKLVFGGDHRIKFYSITD